jgi:hypothetical protein
VTNEDGKKTRRMKWDRATAQIYDTLEIAKMRALKTLKGTAICDDLKSRKVDQCDPRATRQKHGMKPNKSSINFDKLKTNTARMSAVVTL